MAKKHTPLIVGNWKQNPSTIDSARKLFLDIGKTLARKKIRATVAIAAPMPFISELGSLSPRKRVELTAQNVSYEAGGTHTGEVSPVMLKSIGVTSVIIGHSERRAAGGTDEIVHKKLLAVLSNGLTAIVCIGEKKRDDHGHYFNVVEKQLRSALTGVQKSKLSRLVITYEPVWAISKGDGKGHTATPEDAHEMKLFIQKIIADLFGRTSIAKVRILYGGSVNAGNAEKFLKDGEVDGFLVGGASLKAEEFGKIITIANEYAKT